MQLVQQHPVAASLIAVAVLATACGSGWLWVQRSRRLVQQERTVAVTDVMSGSQFEHWVARLMWASGCRRVRVSGGSGDMGADVTGYAPDGQRLVVQCKRYSAKVGSPEVQRFAGTARHIHDADVALLVTNNYLTAQAVDVARRCHISVVDRDTLGRWADSLSLPIASIPGQPVTSAPAWLIRLPVARRIYDLRAVWSSRRERRCSRPIAPAARQPAPAAPASTTPANTAPPPVVAPARTEWWNETP
ncbi:restriction endonuclease [Micromonospora sp. R77]|uniref:restriction endonuclease n=1 Tax=Micromonospora sp. R77 TaxID=2925836 RepID=UPI001F621B44|nr:restriction endonuclease [Micromonospora sp. R77]MCI4063369.1 restriction endonuclease [Micromonospora sp. R77]